MRTNYIIPTLLLFSAVIQSQTLTQAFNEPVAGDVENFYTLDTSAFSQGLPVNTGSNVTWDYALLKGLSPQLQNLYVLPDTSNNAQDYPGCTLVEKGLFNAYYKSVTSPTTQTELLGINSSTLTLNLTNSAIVARYPISFGTNLSDNLSGNFSAFNFTGTCSGKMTTNADGKGTLILPGNTLSNILRLKSVQTLTFFTSGIIPVGTARQTILSYYHSSSKFPVLSITYTSITPISGSATATSFANGNAGFFVVGINENQRDEIKIYPNPSSGIVQISVSESANPGGVVVRSLTGEIVLAGAFQKTVDLSAMPAGIYLIQVTTSKGLLRQTVVRQ